MEIPKYTNKDTEHLQRLGTVWPKVFKQGAEYRQNPLTEDEVLENELFMVLAIGEKLNIPSNGLMGYHENTGIPFKERVPISRDSLVSVIKEGNVRPARGYTSDLNPFVDVEGNLNDGNEVQAFCAPLRRGSYFDSAGNFGPYWVIFDNTALSSDRSKGIGASHHKFYLVPSDEDRQYVVDKLKSEHVDSNAVQKIITYKEFIKQHERFLPDGFMEDDKTESKTSSESYQKGRKFFEEAIKDPDWKIATSRIMKEISNSKLDPEYRRALIGDLDLIPGKYRKGPNMTEFYRVVKGGIIKIIKDKNEDEKVRERCVYKFNLNRELDPADIEYLSNMASTPGQSTNIELALIKVLSHFDNPKVPETMAQIASSKEFSIQIRHSALMEISKPTKESVNVLLDYLKNGTEQGKKIAMITIGALPFFDIPMQIVEAVKTFQKTNGRNDTEKYIKAFFDKYAYIFDKEKFVRYIPRSRGEFERKAESMATNYNEGGDMRWEMKNGLLIYLLTEVRSGKVKLVDGPHKKFDEGEIVVSLDDRRNDLGIIDDNTDGISVTFGGYGYSGFPSSPLTESTRLKKILYT